MRTAPLPKDATHKSPCGVFGERTDQRALQTCFGRAFKFPKMNPIKANKAILRGQPQKSIVALQNGVDGGLEQAFFLAPNAMRILRQGFAGIERIHRPDCHQTDD